MPSGIPCVFSLTPYRCGEVVVPDEFSGAVLLAARPALIMDLRVHRSASHEALAAKGWHTPTRIHSSGCVVTGFIDKDHGAV